MTGREAGRRFAVKAGEWLLFAALALAWFFFWSVVAAATGIRATMHQNPPVAFGVTFLGFALALGCAWVCWRWIMQKLRERKAGGFPPAPGSLSE